MTRSLQWPVKDPGATRTYALDISDDVTNTIIQQVSIAIKPHGTGELTANAIMVSGDLVEVSLASGAPGRSYLVKVDITPYNAAPVQYVCWIYIDRTLAIWPITDPDFYDFGIPLTWSYAPALDFSKKQNSWMYMLV